MIAEVTNMLRIWFGKSKDEAYRLTCEYEGHIVHFLQLGRTERHVAAVVLKHRSH